MEGIQGGTHISRRDQHKPNDPHRKCPPQSTVPAGRNGPRQAPPPPPHGIPKYRLKGLCIQATPFRQGSRGGRGEVTPLLSGRAGPKPRCLHQGRCPRLGTTPLSFLCSWTELTPAPQRPGPPPPPAPICRVQNQHQGTRLGAAGRTLHGPSPPPAAPVPPPAEEGEERWGRPLQQRCDSDNISKLWMRTEPLDLLLSLLLLLAYCLSSAFSIKRQD